MCGFTACINSIVLSAATIGSSISNMLGRFLERGQGTRVTDPRHAAVQCSNASTTETQWQCYSRGHGPLAPMAQGRVTPGQVRHITRSALGRGPATRGGPAAADCRKWPQGPRPQERPQALVCRGWPRGQGGQLIHCQEQSPGHSPAAIFA